MCNREKGKYPFYFAGITILFILLTATTALGGVFGATGRVLGNDGAMALPGTGLSNLSTADPAQPYGYIQCLYAGADGSIDPPNEDGSPGGDEFLLMTEEYTGQYYTAVGEGFPFLPNGRFSEDFNYSLAVGSQIYCRAWEGTSPESSYYYGDSSLYAFTDTNFDSYDFGVWSTTVNVPGKYPDADGDSYTEDVDCDDANCRCASGSCGGVQRHRRTTAMAALMKVVRLLRRRRRRRIRQRLGIDGRYQSAVRIRARQFRLR